MAKAFIELAAALWFLIPSLPLSFLSPLVYREFVLPRTRELIEYSTSRGVRNVPLIIGGNTTKMLDEYLETGANNVLCDARADVTEFLHKCSAARRAFRRNMDSTDFLTLSSEDIYTAQSTV